MPIKGLTTRRRLPRVGKIRLGIMVQNQNGKKYPKATEYFVCPPEVEAVYGPQPTVLDIMIPIDDEEIIASTWYKSYSASRGIVCRGDGITAQRLIDSSKKFGEPGTGVVTGPIARHDAPSTEMAYGITCPGRECPYYAGEECREVMNFQFLMPRVPGLGVWQISTGSFHSILNIYSGIELVRGIFGRASMTPLKLSLEPMEVSPDGKKKTVRVLHLRSSGTLAEIAEQQAKPLIAALMPPPDEEADDLLFPEDGFEPPEAELDPPAVAPPPGRTPSTSRAAASGAGKGPSAPHGPSRKVSHSQESMGRGTGRPYLAPDGQKQMVLAG